MLGLTLTLAVADGEGDADADGEAERDGDGVGFGVVVLVGAGVGAGFGAAVTANFAETETRPVLPMKLALTVCDPAEVCPLNGFNPDLVTVHVCVVFGNDVVARKDPSHLSVTAVPGQFPLVVYDTRALNVVVARPLLGESVSDVAAKTGKANDTKTRTSPAMIARRCTLLASYQAHVNHRDAPTKIVRSSPFFGVGKPVGPQMTFRGRRYATREPVLRSVTY